MKKNSHRKLATSEFPLNNLNSVNSIFSFSIFYSEITHQTTFAHPCLVGGCYVVSPYVPALVPPYLLEEIPHWLIVYSKGENVPTFGLKLNPEHRLLSVKTALLLWG